MERMKETGILTSVFISAEQCQYITDNFKTIDFYMQGWDDEKDEETDKFYKTKISDADPGWLAYIIATKK